MKTQKTSCDTCLYYEYDEEYDSYECQVSLDEDDMAHILSDSRYTCPYYRYGDEYSIVRKQM